jgi:Tektin family
MSYQLSRRGNHYNDSQSTKFTHKDWTFNNQLKSRISCDQQKLADRVICEAERVIDETKETTTKFKKETDYRLEERVSHIAFTVEELREQKKFGEREQEILKVWRHLSDLLIFFCKLQTLIFQSYMNSIHFIRFIIFSFRTQKTESKLP